MNRYLSCQDELIMFSYLCGTVYVASFCILSGELVSGFVFLQEKVRKSKKWGIRIRRWKLWVFFVVAYVSADCSTDKRWVELCFFCDLHFV